MVVNFAQFRVAFWCRAGEQPNLPELDGLLGDLKMRLDPQSMKLSMAKSMISHCIFGYPICKHINIPKCHLGVFFLILEMWVIPGMAEAKRPTPLQEHTALQTKWKNVEAGTDWKQPWEVYTKNH